MKLEDISTTSKKKFKSIVKEAVNKKAFEYLKLQQNSHSKSRNLVYSGLKLQPYLAPNAAKLSIQEKQSIFCTRSRMMDVLCNYKSGKKSLQCRACDKSPEEQVHLIKCEKLSVNELTRCIPEYNDLFSENVDKVAQIGRLLKEKFEMLKKIIKQNQAKAPSLSAAACTVRKIVIWLYWNLNNNKFECLLLLTPKSFIFIYV